MLRPRALGAAIELFPVRTPTLPPATHTNSYALGDREVLLVEPSTPYDDERSAFVEWARGIASAGRTLIGLFATHHHIDHIGGATFLARTLSLPLFAHPITLDRLRDREGLDLRPTIDGASFELGGPVSTRWEALHTPGHAPGHLCLHDRDSHTLLAGDMVANGSTILIPPDDDGDMRAYLAQLRRLEALDSTLALPAHGEPIDDPGAILRAYVAHRLMREEKVRSAYEAFSTAQGRAPLDDELVPLAYDDTPMHLWPIARMSMRAHLVKLVLDGRITASS